MVMGALAAYARRIPNYIRWAFYRYLTYSVQVDNRDRVYDWMKLWIEDQDFNKKAHHMVATLKTETNELKRDRKPKPEVIFTPAPSTHWVWRNGNLLSVTLTKEKMQGEGESGTGSSGKGVTSFHESVTIRSYLSWNKSSVLTLVHEAQAMSELATKDSVKVYTFGDRYYDAWQLQNLKPKRPKASMVLDQTLLDDLIEDIKRFKSEQKWYNDNGIPWKRGYLLEGPPGNGKCLGRGTPILMHDGSVKAVENVRLDDLVMGPDSRPRRVLSLAQGQEEMYRVTPTKGASYVVNKSHILSLKMSCAASGYKKNSIVNISVEDYLNSSNSFKYYAKGWRTGVEFDFKRVPCDPYFLGLWLGDGSSHNADVTTADKEISDYLYEFTMASGVAIGATHGKGRAQTYTITKGSSKGCKKEGNAVVEGLRAAGVINNKHIPLLYKANSRDVRLQVLAGLVDSDGSVNCNGYDIISKFEVLADDIVYLARSLGFAAYKTPCRKHCVYLGQRREATYYRVCISGDLSQVPVKIPRKKCNERLQKKNVLVTGISVEPIGAGDYFGFGVDEDHLFLLGDFTVTHNSSLITALATELQADIHYLNLASAGMNDGTLSKALSCVPQGGLVILEEIDTIFKGRVSGKKGLTASGPSFGGLLNSLDGIVAQEGTITFMTTNHKEVLDPALIRPGRCDLQVHISNSTKNQAEKMFQRFFPDQDISKAKFFAEHIPEDLVSMAAMQEYFMEHKNQPEAALEKVSVLIERAVKTKEQAEAAKAAEAVAEVASASEE